MGLGPYGQQWLLVAMSLVGTPWHLETLRLFGTVEVSVWEVLLAEAVRQGQRLFV